jgi:hypothetical protein
VHRALEPPTSARSFRGNLGWSGPAGDAVGEVLEQYLGENEPTPRTMT